MTKQDLLATDLEVVMEEGYFATKHFVAKRQLGPKMIPFWKAPVKEEWRVYILESDDGEGPTLLWGGCTEVQARELVLAHEKLYREGMSQPQAPPAD